MATVTNNKFHKKMREISEAYSMYSYEEVFMKEKILSVKEIFDMMVPYENEDFPSESQEIDKRSYFKAISEIDYEAASEVYGRSDEVITVEGKEITIPFYEDDLFGISVERYSLEGDTLKIISESMGDIRDTEDTFEEVQVCFIYTCSLEEGRVVSVSVEMEEHPLSDNKKFYVEYEHYSSYCVDPGSTKTVFAQSAERAERIVRHLVCPPDDHLSWDITVYDKDYNVVSEDDSSYSYLNAIERPGIAKAEVV